MMNQRSSNEKQTRWRRKLREGILFKKNKLTVMIEEGDWQQWKQVKIKDLGHSTGYIAPIPSIISSQLPWKHTKVTSQNLRRLR